jgi:hypothetical protein
MAQVRVFIYRYIEIDEEDEETDLTGEIELPGRGDIIYRRQKAWKVAAIYSMPVSNPFPRFRILLTDMSRPECVN